MTLYDLARRQDTPPADLDAAVNAVLTHESRHPYADVLLARMLKSARKAATQENAT
jgi:hypothetical protein